MAYKMLARILFAVNLFGGLLIYFGFKQSYTTENKLYKAWLVIGFSAIFLSWVWFAGQLGAKDVTIAYGVAVLGVGTAMNSIEGRIRAILCSTIRER